MKIKIYKVYWIYSCSETECEIHTNKFSALRAIAGYISNFQLDYKKTDISKEYPNYRKAPKEKLEEEDIYYEIIKKANGGLTYLSIHWDDDSWYTEIRFVISKLEIDGAIKI